MLLPTYQPISSLMPTCLTHALSICCIAISSLPSYQQTIILYGCFRLLLELLSAYLQELTTAPLPCSMLVPYLIRLISYVVRVRYCLLLV